MQLWHNFRIVKTKRPKMVSLLCKTQALSAMWWNDGSMDDAGFTFKKNGCGDLVGGDIIGGNDVLAESSHPQLLHHGWFSHLRRNDTCQRSSYLLFTTFHNHMSHLLNFC